MQAFFDENTKITLLQMSRDSDSVLWVVSKWWLWLKIWKFNFQKINFICALRRKGWGGAILYYPPAPPWSTRKACSLKANALLRINHNFCKTSVSFIRAMLSLLQNIAEDFPVGNWPSLWKLYPLPNSPFARSVNRVLSESEIQSFAPNSE